MRKNNFYTIKENVLEKVNY